MLMHLLLSFFIPLLLQISYNCSRELRWDEMSNMSFDELIKLDIHEQINYLNNGLNKGLSVKQIRESLGVGEKKLQKYLKSINYKYDQKIKNYILVTKVSDTVEGSERVSDYNNNQLVVKDKTKVNIKPVEDERVNPLPVEFTDYDKLINMLNTYQEMSKRIEQLDKYEEMLQWYELQKSVIDVTPPKLEIPPTDAEPVTRSFKIYPDVNEAFKKFCSKNDNYKVQDIISFAIKEFLERYDN